MTSPRPWKITEKSGLMFDALVLCGGDELVSVTRRLNPDGDDLLGFAQILMDSKIFTFAQLESIIDEVLTDNGVDPEKCGFDA